VPRVGGAAGWAVAADKLVHWGMLVTIYGVCAVTFMMTMYALERRGRAFVLAFAFGCVLSSVYAFWSGVWPFGVLELVWSGIAVRRYLTGAPEPA
jgi:predicted CDP-diglyceride synthetase/phosphatidate cytidylyltransferase